jgi:serine/threonine protein kinase
MTDESIFAAALAIPSPSQRAAYLDRACTGQPALRHEIEELLAAHAADNVLDRPRVELGHTGPYESDGCPAAAVGEPIGPYKLLERIGEGGMGEVWVADQQTPIKRRVALKLIKPGMDSRNVLGRFEAERQALAVMDHPNIAMVLDAGTTPDGRPYFVMELVKGTPITEFCDARRLTPHERLELFVPVCQAIQHAHQKGVIHRDIKPSNVLVALHDETPVPKVIDFGVAKAIGQQLTEKTIYTGFGALVGTPAYMAPEQATFNQLDIDTRADVYALGVLLYELLTGSPPLEPERLKKAALDEMLRIVRDEEPPRPSQRLSTSQSQATIAATRQSDPVKLSQMMRRELDWIVMKALEKDRGRRYETANGLAKDVQRYLAGDAVEACPPTLAYRLRKVYRRNRAAVLTAAAFALVLVAATGVSVAFAVQARRAETLAVAERDQVAAAEARAADEAAEAKAVNEFFCRDVLGRANPLLFGDREMKVRTILDEITPQIESRFGSRPLAEATVRHAVGDAYLGMGEMARARPQLERAFAIRQQLLGDRNPDTLLTQGGLALVTGIFGDHKRSRSLAEEAVQKARKALGDDHPVTLKLRSIWGNYLVGKIEAEEHLAAAEAGMSRLYGRDDPWTLLTLSLLAKARTYIGHFDAAEADIRRGLQAQARMPDGLTAISLRGHFTYRLGDLEFHRRRYLQAADAYARAIDDFAKVWGEDNPGFTSNVRLCRGISLQLAGRYPEAVAALAEAEASYLKKLPPNAPNAVGARAFLARCLLATGHRAEAIAKARAAIEGADADALLLGELEEAYPHAVLGACLTAEGKYAEAETHLRAAHKVLAANQAPVSPGYRPMLTEIDRWTAELYEAWGKPDEAAKWRKELEAAKLSERSAGTLRPGEKVP